MATKTTNERGESIWAVGAPGSYQRTIRQFPDTFKALCIEQMNCDIDGFPFDAYSWLIERGIENKDTIKHLIDALNYKRSIIGLEGLD